MVFGDMHPLRVDHHSSHDSDRLFSGSTFVEIAHLHR